QAPIEGYEDAIVVPPINANNFELKQTLMLALKSAKALVKSNLPMEQGRIKLPGSCSLGVADFKVEQST
nr:hypothetical protein [Tanacetum cinerariifolium]